MYCIYYNLVDASKNKNYLTVSQNPVASDMGPG